MDWPEKTGEYLVLIKEVLGTEHFTEAYFRGDTKKFYFHTFCNKEKDLVSFWKVEVTGWIILREMSLDDFDENTSPAAL